MILIPVTLKESRRFVEKFHRHNKAPQGGLFSIGLSRGGYLVGVAIVGRPVARMYQDGVTAEVTPGVREGGDKEREFQVVRGLLACLEGDGREKIGHLHVGKRERFFSKGRGVEDDR